MMLANPLLGAVGLFLLVVAAVWRQIANARAASQALAEVLVAIRSADAEFGQRLAEELRATDSEALLPVLLAPEAVPRLLAPSDTRPSPSTRPSSPFALRRRRTVQADRGKP